MASTIAPWVLAAAAGLVAWCIHGQKADLVLSRDQWRDDALASHARSVVERAKARRLAHKLLPTGIAPPRDGDPWPEPDPIYGPPEPVPDAPAWCYEPVGADPEGELVGGVFHLDERLVNTSEVVLPWLEPAS